MKYKRVSFFGWIDPGDDGAPSHFQQSTGEDVIRRFTVEGDTLTVASVSGSLPVYVSLGGDEDTNPYVRVKAGDVIGPCPGGFSILTVRTGARTIALAGGRQYVRAVFYVSSGPFLKPAPRQYGLRRGFRGFHTSLTNTTPRLLAAMLMDGASINASEPYPYPPLGADGGTVWIKNLEASGGETVYIDFRTDPQPAFTVPGLRDGFPLAPGETIKLELDDALAGNADYVASGGTGGLGWQGSGIVLWSSKAAGATSVGILVNRGDFDFAAGTFPDDSAPPLQG